VHAGAAAQRTPTLRRRADAVAAPSIQPRHTDFAIGEDGRVVQTRDCHSARGQHLRAFAAIHPTRRFVCVANDVLGGLSAVFRQGTTADLAPRTEAVLRNPPRGHNPQRLPSCAVKPCNRSRLPPSPPAVPGPPLLCLVPPPLARNPSQSFTSAVHLPRRPARLPLSPVLVLQCDGEGSRTPVRPHPHYELPEWIR
jgi:hypothetical protein